MSQPFDRDEFRAHAHMALINALTDYRALIDTAQTTAEVFPLWEDLRELGRNACAVSDAAGDRCEQLLKET